ncbi:sugar transporter [uncultured Helicobacter sp.]|uniref:sugar transporter n=1 Tax=uncultured Helicobacter sp. TaxID=175537 RepID=UPI0026100415|nr:sugar transporter [uncultured Helicobacter sp.]
MSKDMNKPVECHTKGQNPSCSATNSHTTDSNAKKPLPAKEGIPYLALLSLVFAVFVFNTSEFVPIGLLSLIASDFNMSESGAGMLITMYAWVVALVSLPLMLLLSNIELKRLMLLVISLFVLSHIISALSQNYGMLMLSRIGVACGHAVFWSIASPMAVRLVPKNKQSIALSFIITGGAIAIILGLPLGRVIGLSLGWRASFLSIGGVALLTGLLLWRVFPKLPNTDSISLDMLPKMLKNKSLIAIYGIAAVLVTAHFSAYSYIEPFLLQIAHFSEEGITFTLVAFGAIGIVGSVIFAKFYEGRASLFVGIALFGICGSLFLLHFGAIHTYLILFICIFWGLVITLFNLSFQSQVIFLSPQGTAIAMSIYSGIYNVGIGSGALIGGLVSDWLNVGYVGYFGGAIALLVCGFYIKRIVWSSAKSATK